MLAKELNVKMRISLEVDVGLHRGGFKVDPSFVETLEHIKHSPWLTLSGLMGYEAHISKLPDILGGARLAFNCRCASSYQQSVALLTKTLGAQALDGLCLNTGGSSTYPLYDAGVRVATEIATASALVKPTDFDVEALTHHLPAAFIAAPVLKRVHKSEIPEAPMLRACFERWENCPKKDVIFTVVVGWQRLAILRLAPMRCWGAPAIKSFMSWRPQ